MSRVFKSEQCVETAPRQLDPVKPVEPVKPIEPVEPIAPELPGTDIEIPSVDTPDPAELVESILAEARLQSDTLIQSAQKKADEIIAAANLEAEQLKTETYRTAFETATKAAQEAVQEKMAADLEKAVAILNETELIRTERIASSEPQLLRLAVTIAQKIISQELRLDTSAIRSIISNALTKVAGATDIKVRIHPDDLEMLSSEDNLNFESVLGEPKPIRFEADPTITHGGCFVETEIGKVDARITKQLETIMTELLKVGRLS